MISFSRVSDSRARTVVREIAVGSQARGRFFVMLVTASMIAAFGLLANSTAVIIGAMLVSPLMTPIFGIALGMLRGNTRLWWSALASESLGVALAVGSSFLVGLAPYLATGDATDEMLIRTQPNLIDLFVAIFAGFAGAYALLDERVSPAMPGVAIATAIVPPLSTCGLCLAFGSWSGAFGAMLLFLANFVAILLVAILTFWAGGLARGRRSMHHIVARLGPTIVGFIVIASILTNSLLRIAHTTSIERSIQITLSETLAETYGASLMDVTYAETNESVQVLATVRSYRTISPAWVTAIQTKLRASIDQPVDLAVRTIRSRDVYPLGSAYQIVQPDLNGRLIEKVPSTNVSRESLASQVIREYFDDEPGFELTRIEHGSITDDSTVVVAYVNAIRRISAEEMFAVETLLRDRLQSPGLRFLIRVNSATLHGREGDVLTEWTNFTMAGKERVPDVPKLDAKIRSAISKIEGLVLLQNHFHWSGKGWRVLSAVAGPSSADASIVKQIEDSLGETNDPVEVLLWKQNDYIIAHDGITTYDQLTAPLINDRRAYLRRFFQSNVEASSDRFETAGLETNANSAKMIDLQDRPSSTE